MTANVNENMPSMRPRPNDVELAAFIALENNKEFGLFKEFLKRRMFETALLSTRQVGEQCHWIQGRSHEDEDLYRCLVEARKLADLNRKVRNEK